jgi:hypothetical protein
MGSWGKGTALVNAALLVGIMLTVSACSTTEPEVTSSPAPTAEARTAFELAAGDCLNDPGGLADSLGEVAVVPCDQPHQTEVFAVFEYDAADEDPYPGERRLTRVAERQCRGARFTDYVGVQKADSELLVLQATPAEDTWAQGDREIVCLLHTGGEQELTESLRGSGR